MNRVANYLLATGGFISCSTIFLNTFFYTVDAGESAVMFDKAFGGVKQKVYGEGMHFYVPLA